MTIKLTQQHNTLNDDNLDYSIYTIDLGINKAWDFNTNPTGSLYIQLLLQSLIQFRLVGMNDEIFPRLLRWTINNQENVSRK